MSITIMALRLRSIVTFCGAAAILSGTGFARGVAMSISRALAHKVKPARGAPSACSLVAIWSPQAPVIAARQASSLPLGTLIAYLRSGTDAKSGRYAMNKFDRRGFLIGTAGAAGLVMLGGLGMPARAAGPLNVGVLIPGSKSDKGWMESGYDGMKAGEKKLGTKVAVKFIENVKFGDMEQVLVTLAGKNDLVIGIGGQTQASVFKVAPRFPKVKFAIICGNSDPKKPDNVSGYDVRQAEIAFAAGAAAAMLSKTGGVSYVGGREISDRQHAGIEFGHGGPQLHPKIKYFPDI